MDGHNTIMQSTQRVEFSVEYPNLVEANTYILLNTQIKTTYVLKCIIMKITMTLSVEHPNFVEHRSIFQPQPNKTQIFN